MVTGGHMRASSALHDSNASQRGARRPFLVRSAASAALRQQPIPSFVLSNGLLWYTKSGGAELFELSLERRVFGARLAFVVGRPTREPVSPSGG